MPVRKLFNQLPKISSVSEITHRIKQKLESEFLDIWVEGEISNFHAHSSGHYYFSLKDSKAVLSSVMFRGSNTRLKFKPESGLKVICQGRISIYAPHGKYQFYVEHMEPEGLGALQLAFEQLKEKLSKEGLFAAELKKKIPVFPRKVGIITSPTGAVLHDIYKVLSRRNPQVKLILAPVSVQGKGCAQQVSTAIQQLQQLGEIDTIIIARGGGSLEDLWAFNEEQLVRAVAASQIPIISAVGHETDFSLCDFAADLRAPTPSAAAELVAIDLDEIQMRVLDCYRQLKEKIHQLLQTRQHQLVLLSKQLKNPLQLLQEKMQRLDEISQQLHIFMKHRLDSEQNQLKHLSQQLNLLSPLNILGRGYSLVYKDGKIIQSAQELEADDEIKIRFAQGEACAQIKNPDCS